MRPLVSLILLALATRTGSAQEAGGRDSAVIARIEQRIEDAVVARRIGFLDGVYAPDFRFKHSTGDADTRREWLASVRRARFASRRVDSLYVEVHGNVALTTGRLHVRRAPDDPEWSVDPRWREYTIRYAHVYVRRAGRWSLLTHHSTGQTFGPPEGPASSGSPAGSRSLRPPSHLEDGTR